MTKASTSAAVVLSREEEELERIHAIELALHERAADILACAMRAPEIAPNASEPPAEWLEHLTTENARRAFEIAKAAWLSQKDAPVFLKLAQAFLQGSMKVRAHEGTGPKILNATIVTVTAPAPQFPERIVKDDDEEPGR